jgi:hypothetical protein
VCKDRIAYCSIISYCPTITVPRACPYLVDEYGLKLGSARGDLPRSSAPSVPSITCGDDGRGFADDPTMISVLEEY